MLIGLGPKASNVILYHIPQVTAVGLSMALVDRLKKAFPQQVTGVKDSSGDWNNAQALLKQHGELHILIGDERLLARAMTLGASGAITGLANIAPDLMLPLIDGIEDPGVNAMVELGPADDRIRERLTRHWTLVGRQLAAAVEQAQAAREVRIDVPAPQLAEMVVLTVTGIAVFARQGETKNVVPTVLALLSR